MKGSINIMNTDRENMNLAQKEYDPNVFIGKKMDLEDKPYIATLSDINDNRTNNGEQIFTYTKTRHGTDAVTPDASLSERSKVEEITILYRGSTNPFSFFF